MARLSVVILNWNGRRHLERYLPSVVANTSGDAEVVVADNGSTDSSLEWLAATYPEIRTVCLDRNYGFAGGYNRALKQVDTEYVLLLNSDVEVTPNWWQPLVEVLDKNADVAAVAPKLLSDSERDKFEYAGASGGFIDYLGYPFCRGRILSSVERDEGQYDDSREIFWASGAAMCCRREVFMELGGFDEDFFAHMEEIDLCWRMLSRGGEIYAVPQSKVYHVGGATLNKSNPRKTFLNFRNNLLMLYKNLPTGELRRVMYMRALLDYVAALKFLLTGAWGDFKAVLRARREYRRMRGEYEGVREQNLVAAVVPVIKERSLFSLLWQYYLKGKKHFSQLD